MCWEGHMALLVRPDGTINAGHFSHLASGPVFLHAHRDVHLSHQDIFCCLVNLSFGERAQAHVQGTKIHCTQNKWKPLHFCTHLAGPREQIERKKHYAMRRAVFATKLSLIAVEFSRNEFSPSSSFQLLICSTPQFQKLKALFCIHIYTYTNNEWSQGRIQHGGPAGRQKGSE